MNFARGKLMLASFLTLVASGVGFATRTAAGDWYGESRNLDCGAGRATLMAEPATGCCPSSDWCGGAAYLLYPGTNRFILAFLTLMRS